MVETQQVCDRIDSSPPYRPHPPDAWDEVEGGQVVAAELTPAVVLERVEEFGDLLEPGPEVPV
jgi:hypothetical protein